MTSRQSTTDESASRSATIRTRVEAAEVLAASVRPDNTPEIDTRVQDGCVVTNVERETTGGLRTTVDDYVVNLTVAQEIVQAAKRRADAGRDLADANADADDADNNADDADYTTQS